MTDVRYAELHAHTAYSFLDGASQPADLAAEAARLGLTALAVTDHDGLYGVVQFSRAAQEIGGVRTVFGAELHLPAPDGRRHPRERTRATPGRPVLDPPTGIPDPRATHLVVLARGPDGYRALSRAIAQAHLRTGEKGAADYRLDELAAAAGGQWLVLTGCRKGAVRRALAGGDPSGTVGVAPGGCAAARAELDRLVALFGRDNVAVEVTAVGDAHDAELADALAALAAQARLPLVATGNVHYATPRDADLAAALAAVRARSSLDDMDGWLPGVPTAYLRSAAEMLARHRRHPQAVPTAAELADECAFDLSLVAPDLPPYPVPPGHDEASWLRELVRQGAAQRYGPPESERVPGAYAQLAHELAVIEELHFPGYFLVVYDLVRFCDEHGILAQGRGSAANSAVCYALGITAVEPVGHHLLFERFLAPERDGPPDIDVDIESRRREEVIQYVYAKHGREHAAQVADVITYRPRSAVRDAARALGYDAGQQDAWCTSIERWGSLRGPRTPSKWWTVYRSAPAAPESAWGGVGSSSDESAPDESRIPEAVLDLAERMLRLPRHLGIHSGGMVMCDRPVIEVCPVQWARTPGRTVL
ncbi:MAG: PHP domain-containing protein, partial [Micrococcales bacterium]|nr:PHP domain-containing protein [Micrococcales bacterium]